MSQRTSRKNLERSLEKLMVDGVAGINLAPPSCIDGIVVESDINLDVSQSDIKTVSGNVQSLTLKSSLGMQTVAFTDEKDDAPSVLPTKSMLDGNVNSSSGHSVNHGADFNPLALQLCIIFKEYNL